MPFQGVDGLSIEQEVLEYLQALSGPDIGMEELTLAVEGFQRSPLGRQVIRGVLGDVDSRFQSEWPRPLYYPGLGRFQALADRGVLSLCLRETVTRQLTELGGDPTTR